MDDQIKTMDSLKAAKGFKLLHLNVRSLTKKIDQLRIWFEESKLDVITLSETWLNESVYPKSVNINGYTSYRQDRNFSVVSKKRRGGLLMYVRQDHASSSESLVEMNKSTGDIEAQWLIIYRPHCKNVVVGNIYRPPNGNFKKAIDYLEECMLSFDLDTTELFILGDLNVNYKNKLSAEYKKLSFFVKANGLKQIIDTTTRITSKTKSLLDLILTNSLYVRSAGTLDHYISDHQPIFVTKKKGRDSRPRVEFEGRSYRNFNKDSFRDKLMEIDWADYYQKENPAEAWEFIFSKVESIIDGMCPLRTFKIRNYRPDWITHELLEQIADRDYFYNKAKQTGDEDDWNVAKHLRNVTNANIRQARKDFVVSELQENTSDYKKFWKTIRSVIPNDKGSARNDILLTHDGKKVPKNEVAHYVNNYFVNIGKEIGGNFTYTNKEGESGDTTSDGWSFSEFNEIEVMKVVKSINVSKSSGLSNISSFVVKEAFSILIPQITFLFNLTIRTSIFPRAWKEALVIPIPKTGNAKQVQNYRPISLLPLPGKLLEKLVHAQISEYLENISHLTENQHGFRKGHSTIHSVAQVTNYINTKMDGRLPTLAAFIDFRKAFDCVQHPVLLDKLADLGLDRAVTDWFRSYLCDRKQRVLANDTLSSWQSVTQGVPQGSVLGPLFYIYCMQMISLKGSISVKLPYMLMIQYCI